MKQRLLQIFALSAIMLNVSCEDDLNTFNLEVTVTINEDVRVPNALVYINVPGIPEDSSSVNLFKYTDEQGRATAKLKAESVVQVSASRPGYKSCKFIKINPGNNQVTLDLLAFNDAENGCL